MSATAWSTGVLGSTQESAVKEAPTSPMAAKDFTIKAFGAESTETEQITTIDISSTLQRKESLPKASPSPSPRGELTAEKSAGKIASVPTHQRLYEQGLAQRAKREAAAAKQAAELTFKPEISPRARNLSTSGRLSMNGKPAPVYERLSSVGTDAQKRLERLRQERLEAERQACTFTPRVNKYSEKLLAQRTSNYGGSAQARQQAYMKKMNQTFGGAMRTSGYGSAGVAQPGSASIGGSLRSRQLLAQRKSLVGCDAAAVNQELPEKLKRELQAAYGIKPRDESPLEEVERWYKAALKEQADIARAAEAAQQAAWAESLREVEDWWRAACGQELESAFTVEKILEIEEESVVAAAAAVEISTEVAEQETKLDEVKQLLEVKEAELMNELTQLDEALHEVNKTITTDAVDDSAAAAEATVAAVVAAAVAAVIKEEEEMKAAAEVPAAAAAAAAVEESAEAADDGLQKVDEDVVVDAVEEEVAVEAEIITEEVAAVKLQVGKKAAIKYHTARINAAIRLHGNKAKTAIRMHSAKVSKALKKGSSSSSAKVKHHAAAMAAAIQKNSAKLAEVMTHHSARIAALTKDAAAAAAIKQRAAAFAATMQQLAADMSANAQQYSALTAAEAKQKSAAVAAAMKAAAAAISVALHEFAAATAATLGKHGSGIVAALQELAARIAAALKVTAGRIATAVKKYRSSIAKAGLQLHRSKAGTQSVQLVA